jgi:hypothetical protein
MLVRHHVKRSADGIERITLHVISKIISDKSTSVLFPSVSRYRYIDERIPGSIERRSSSVQAALRAGFIRVGYVLKLYHYEESNLQGYP